MIIPNKELGQHFMVNKKLLSEIIRWADIKSDEIVLEIGSGEGVLTNSILSLSPKKLICIEIDERYKIKNPFVEFIVGDALEKISGLKFNNLVANIPYHISEPLMIKLLKLKTPKITFVCGMKFAKIITSDSIIGLITQSIYNVEIIKKISSDSFKPQPSVDSALVILRLKDEFNDVFTKFYYHQRQKVKNHLLMLCRNIISKKQLREGLSEIKNIENKQLYTLTREEYKELYSFISESLI